MRKERIREDMTCGHAPCSKVFKRRKPTQIYCNAKCRLNAWIALHPRVDLTKKGATSGSE